MLVQFTTQQIADEGTRLAMSESEAPLLNTDLDVVKRLLAKGVQHNGPVPELDALQVSRGLAVAAELLERAEHALSVEDLDCLEWSFSIAAAYDERAQADVRRVERTVRKAMGLGPRLVFVSRSDEDLA